MSPHIEAVDAWTILDSRGRPTIRVRVSCSDGTAAVGDAPAGVSRGTHEAAELRDGTPAWNGLGVDRAIDAAKGELADAVIGRDPRDQEDVDRSLRAADGTPNLSRLGGNAVVAISAAAARCGASVKRMPLYRHLATRGLSNPPIPLMNVLNGGAHAAGGLRIQECMIVPLGMSTVAERVRCGAEVYAALRTLLTERRYPTTVGDEGGFAVGSVSFDGALDLLAEAIERAGYRSGGDVALAVDAAANEFYRNGKYEPEAGRVMEASEYVEWWASVVGRHPIVMLEDPMAEDDDLGWRLITERLGPTQRIVGDDVFVTDAETIARAARSGVANTALIKPNQAGTVSDALAAVRAARTARYSIVVSHRSGETADTLVADLAWACGAEFLKAGAPARAERTEKYNRLIEIERALDGRA